MKTSIFTKKTRVDEPVESVFAWHERPGAIKRLSPPWDSIKLVSQSNGINPGSKVRLKISALGPLRINWTARHVGYEKNRLFQDIQETGPFSHWKHTHRFIPDGQDACVIEDRIEYALPFHPVTTTVFGTLVRSRLDRIFTYRHETMAADIADHRKYALKPSRILISGSNGLIASTLIPFLTTGGHKVCRLLRTPPGAVSDCFYFNPVDGIIDTENMEAFDVVIHLAGENIGNGPWTEKKKRRIMESRTKSTALLAEAIAKMKKPPKLFICASAIGYYGDRGKEYLDESSPPGDDFISAVCKAWEESATPAINAGIRTVFLRIGVALTPEGGALQKLLPLFKAGLGGKIGSGEQYLSWISIDDVACGILHLMANQNIEGPVNLVSPTPLTNNDFSKKTGQVLSRPAFFTVPSTAIKMFFGEMGKETVLSSTRVIPEKLLASGYRFRHPDLESALSHLLGITRQRNNGL